MCGGRAGAAHSCARVFAHVLGARIASVVVHVCVRGTRPEARRKGPTLPHTAEQAAAQRYLLRVPITCMNLIFSSLNYTHSRDCSRLQRGNT